MALLVSQQTVAAVAAAAALTAAELGAPPQVLAAAVARAVHNCWRWTVPAVDFSPVVATPRIDEPWRGPALSSIRLAHCRLSRAQAALFVGSQGVLVQAPEATPETLAEPSVLLPGTIAVDAAVEHSPTDQNAEFEGLQDLSLDAAIPQLIELAQGLLSDEDGTARWEALLTAVPRLV